MSLFVPNLPMQAPAAPSMPPSAAGAPSAAPTDESADAVAIFMALLPRAGIQGSSMAASGNATADQAAKSAKSDESTPDSMPDAALAQWILGLLPPAPAADAAASPTSAADGMPPAATPVLPLGSTAVPGLAVAAPAAADGDDAGQVLLSGITDGKGDPLQQAKAILAATADGSPVANTGGFELFNHWMHKAEAAMPAPVAAPSPEMSAAPGSPRWAEDFGQQVVWTAKQGLGSAEIHLHPQDLGSVTVSLQMDADQARVTFATTQVHAGAAIEQSLPRLRELFAHEGLNLAQVQVQVAAQNHQQQARQNGGAPSWARLAGDVDEVTAEPLVAPAATVRRSGLLDDYA